MHTCVPTAMSLSYMQAASTVPAVWRPGGTPVFIACQKPSPLNVCVLKCLRRNTQGRYVIVHDILLKGLGAGSGVDEVGEDEELQYDPTAYDCMHVMSLDWPCLR